MSEDPPLTPLEPQTAEPVQPQPERYPFWGYSEVLLMAGLAIPSLMMGWLLVTLALAMSGVRFSAKAIEPVLFQLAGYLILFGCLRIMLRVHYDRPFWRSLAWNPLNAPASRVMALGGMSAIVVSYVGTALRTPITENPMTELMKDPVSLVFMMVFGITLGPLSEELLFRGFLQPVLVRSLGAAPGIIATAVPFGLLHFQQYGNSWRHALIVAMAGAGFGWMRHATGSTKASTVMHGSYNALFFAAELVRRYYEQR